MNVTYVALLSRVIPYTVEQSLYSLVSTNLCLCSYYSHMIEHQCLFNLPHASKTALPLSTQPIKSMVEIIVLCFLCLPDTLILTHTEVWQMGPSSSSSYLCHFITYNHATWLSLWHPLLCFRPESTPIPKAIQVTPTACVSHKTRHDLNGECPQCGNVILC